MTGDGSQEHERGARRPRTRACGRPHDRDGRQLIHIHTVIRTPNGGYYSADLLAAHLRDVLRIASVVVGVGVGLSTAVMTSYPSCYPNGCPGFPTRPTFALYQCALFGAGATAVLVLVSFGIRRPASTAYQGDV